jgi:hypothetical protein
MTMDRDPLLQELFELANRDLPDDEFVERVMSGIEALRRRAIIAWSGAGIVLAIAAWLLMPALVGAVNLLSRALSQSLVDVGEPTALIGQVLSPLNSVAAVVAVAALLIVFAYRKIF